MGGIFFRMYFFFVCGQKSGAVRPIEIRRVCNFSRARCQDIANQKNGDFGRITGTFSSQSTPTRPNWEVPIGTDPNWDGSQLGRHPNWDKSQLGWIARAKFACDECPFVWQFPKKIYFAWSNQILHALQHFKFLNNLCIWYEWKEQQVHEYWQFYRHQKDVLLRRCGWPIAKMIHPQPRKGTSFCCTCF